MKYITIIIILVLNTVNVFTQDIIDPPKLFNKNNLSVYDTRPKSFILSWNWGGACHKIDEALSFSTYHNIPLNGDNFISDIADSMKLIGVLKEPISNTDIIHRFDTNALNCEALFLEPSLGVNITDNFKKRWNDNSGGVYGFKYHNWSVGDTVTSGADQNRFRLLRSRYSGTPTTVLANPYPDDELKDLIPTFSTEIFCFKAGN